MYRAGKKDGATNNRFIIRAVTMGRAKRTKNTTSRIFYLYKAGMQMIFLIDASITCIYKCYWYNIIPFGRITVYLAYRGVYRIVS